MDLDYRETTLLYVFMNCPFILVVQVEDHYIQNAWNLRALKTSFLLPSFGAHASDLLEHLKIKKKKGEYSSLAYLSPSQEVLHTLFIRYGLLRLMAALTAAPSLAFAKVLVPCYQQASACVNTACTSQKRD